MQTRKRTDLAREALDLTLADAQPKGIPDGIRTEETVADGIPVYTVTIETDDGAQRLGRPIGRYVTVEIDDVLAHAEHAFPRAVGVIAQKLRQLLPSNSEGPIMVVGLGNRAVTPDALGPLTAEKILATRHLTKEIPEHFGKLRAVSALVPGVLGVTGMESAEVIGGVVQAIRPSALILVDALAACDNSRLCRTVQLSDSGIAPGSGVGNRRFAIDAQSVGVPCVAVGVPTVVDALTLAADLLGESAELDKETFRARHGQTFVTAKEIDRLVAECAKVIAFAVNTALQPTLTLADIEFFLA
ncbi:MAG: GPR endopeptidase [Ruminococcaceae bacterium]|nr:GPR endopeptidase [Oscillospiraceae bacterium]